MYGRVFRSIRRESGVVKTAVRRMGGGHHHGPPKEGIDAFVAKYLPHNHQVAMFIIGMYGTLFLASRLFSGKKSDVVAAPAVAASASADGSIPEAGSPAFDAWISQEGSVEKLLTSIAK
jgi:hypothetical protein